MRQFLITLGIGLLFSIPAHGAPGGPQAVIYSGTNTVKALKPNLQLGNSGPTIRSGTANPSSSATAGAPGSLYLNTSTGVVYKKTDSGSSTNWIGADAATRGQIFYKGGAGFGSTNTRIVRWSTNVETIGTAVTITQSSTNGDIFNIVESGVYSISVTLQLGGTEGFGLVKNGTQGTTALQSITESATQVILAASTTTANLYQNISWTGYLAASEFLWIQTSGGAFGTSTFSDRIIITKVSN